MLKALVAAAALLYALTHLVLWATAPLHGPPRDTKLDTDAREAWLKRRPKVWDSYGRGCKAIFRP